MAGNRIARLGLVQPSTAPRQAKGSNGSAASKKKDKDGKEDCSDDCETCSEEGQPPCCPSCTQDTFVVTGSRSNSGTFWLGGDMRDELPQMIAWWWNSGGDDTPVPEEPTVPDCVKRCNLDWIRCVTRYTPPGVPALFFGAPRLTIINADCTLSWTGCVINCGETPGDWWGTW